MNKILTMTILALMLLSLSAMGQTKAANSAPSPAPILLHPAEVQQLQIEAKIKDFQILQLQFTQLIGEVKQKNGWGDDVVYDAQRNNFYRVTKPADEKQPHSETKSTLPERKK